MLNNRYRTPEQIQAIRDLFFQKDDIPSGERHLPYQTKVEIFEKKCSDCPYAYLHVTEPLNKATGELEMSYEFHDLVSLCNFLIRFSFAKTLIVERGCLYGTEAIRGSVNRSEYWTVEEIVENGCDMWILLEPVKEQLGDDFFQWYYGKKASVHRIIWAGETEFPLGAQ